jgi:membrane-bound serine protease (ClpP class)
MLFALVHLTQMFAEEVLPHNVEAQLQAHIKVHSTGKNLVGHILIDDRASGINQSTWLYVKQALAYYKKVRPIFIVLELNTPGGEVFAAQRISDALKEFDIQEGIPVVTFINNWAISAGAMLAYSCRFIAVAKDASMGAAEPVLSDGQGEAKTASEKVNSALRADFANRARFFDRNPYIAEAMVDKDIILVLREGKFLKLDSESQLRTTGNDPDILISPKGKLLTLDTEQLMRYGVADLLLLPVPLPEVTEAEKAEGRWPASKTLLFQQPFFHTIPNAEMDVYHMDWKTHLFVWLAHPAVSSILMLGLMMGFYLEMSSPGFGLPGTVAVTCLFLILLSSLSLDIANWLEAILLITGLLVIVLELFVLPTFGLLGFIGVALFIVGLFGMLLPELKSVTFDVNADNAAIAWQAFFEHLTWLCATLLVGVILILLLARYVTPSFVAWNRLVLHGHEQEGYLAGESPKMLPQRGAKGKVFATLRPAGKVIIEDHIYDALTQGNFIERGTPIIVKKLDGSVIVVDVEV